MTSVSVRYIHIYTYTIYYLCSTQHLFSLFLQLFRYLHISQYRYRSSEFLDIGGYNLEVYRDQIYFAFFYLFEIYTLTFFNVYLSFILSRIGEAECGGFLTSICVFFSFYDWYVIDVHTRFLGLEVWRAYFRCFYLADMMEWV